MSPSLFPPIFKIAVAIIISWALFAILCSLILEAIAQLKAERGRFMKSWLMQQLYDQPNGVNWASLLYMHGSIDLLTRSTNKPVSNIEPKLFSETLIDVIANSHLTNMQANQPGVVVKYNNSTLQAYDLAMQVLIKSDVINTLRAALSSAEAQAGTLGESKVYEQLVINIGGWYMSMQERLTLWYKKRSRQWLFIIGLVLGLLMNVDSIQLFEFYNTNLPATEAVINYYANNAPALEKMADHVDTAKFVAPGNRQEISEQLHKSSTYAHTLDSLAKEAKLPIGPSELCKSLHSDKCNCLGWGKLLWKLLGVIITGFAASFGGPFWFQTLKRFYSSKVSA